MWQQDEPRLKNNFCSVGQDWVNTWSQDTWILLPALPCFSYEQKMHLSLPLSYLSNGGSNTCLPDALSQGSRDQGKRTFCRGGWITATPNAAVSVYLRCVVSRTKFSWAYLRLWSDCKPPVQSLVGRSTQEMVISFPPYFVSPSLSILSASSHFEAFSSVLGQLENTRTPQSSLWWHLKAKR